MQRYVKDEADPILAKWVTHESKCDYSVADTLHPCNRDGSTSQATGGSAMRRMGGGNR